MFDTIDLSAMFAEIETTVETKVAFDWTEGNVKFDPKNPPIFGIQK